MTGLRKLRITIFCATILLHFLLISFVAFRTTDVALPIPEAPPPVMRLMDIQEYIPPPPPPPPQAVERQENMVEAIAETMIETEVVPEDQVVVSLMTGPPSPPSVPTQSEAADFLPQGRVSQVPRFSDQDMRRIAGFLRDNYPPIALRSGIEGTVILELFIDARGIIRQINILREIPEGRGFGDVAVAAFREIQAVPAEADGQAVAVRFRYPIRFTVR
jgi:protein TonB